MIKEIMKANVWSVALGSALIMTACSSEPAAPSKDAQPEPAEEMSLDEPNQEVLAKAQTIFYAVPSPFELASLLKNTGAEFNEELLHDAKALDNYSTKRAKALNLGIYSVDLSYSSISGSPKTVEYLQAVKRLTDDFGISGALSPEIMERLDANMDNQDSVQAIMAKAYLEANSYLKSNDMVTLSSFMLAGGWIEGLNIAVGLLDQGENPDVTSLIAEQKFSLENLVDLLSVSGDNPDIAEIKGDFSKLMDLYNQMEEGDDNVAIAPVSSGDGPVVIGGDEDEVTIDPALLEQIKTVAAEIRTKYVTGQ